MSYLPLLQNSSPSNDHQTTSQLRPYWNLWSLISSIHRTLLYNPWFIYFDTTIFITIAYLVSLFNFCYICKLYPQGDKILRYWLLVRKITWMLLHIAAPELPYLYQIRWANPGYGEVANPIIWPTSKIALRRLALGLSEDESALVQVMTWWSQTTSHYPSQYWPRFMSPSSITS